MTNPNVRPDLEALKVPSEGFGDDDMLLRRLWKWEAEMSRSARELAAVPDLKDAAHGTSEVARALRDAAVRIAASNTSTPDPDLIAHIERLQNALKPFATFADTFVDADGWTGPMNVERIVDWFGPSDFREARATLSQGTSNE